jgi:hypothetical protein
MYINKKLIDATKTLSKYEKTDRILAISLGNALILCLVFITLINLEWLQIWIAPRVWLIEYAAKLAT